MLEELSVLWWSWRYGHLGNKILSILASNIEDENRLVTAKKAVEGWYMVAKVKKFVPVAGTASHATVRSRYR